MIFLTGISMEIATEISMEDLWKIHENFDLNHNRNSIEFPWKL